MAYKEYKRQLYKSVSVVETQGACKWARTCGGYNVALGNGLCVHCWDDFGTRSIVNNELREQAQKKAQEKAKKNRGEYPKQNKDGK